MVMSARRWSRRQGWMCSIVKSTASVLHRNVGIIIIGCWTRGSL